MMMKKRQEGTIIDSTIASYLQSFSVVLCLVILRTIELPVKALSNWLMKQRLPDHLRILLQTCQIYSLSKLKIRMVGCIGSHVVSVSNFLNI